MRSCRCRPSERCAAFRSERQFACRCYPKTSVLQSLQPVASLRARYQLAGRCGHVAAGHPSAARHSDLSGNLRAVVILKPVSFNPSSLSRVCVRATNWLGDAVMSLPAIRALRGILPHAHLAVVARPSVAGLYERESTIDRVIPYTVTKGLN